jgi:glycosyltransferase involved in cell wall biosynthesis
MKILYITNEINLNSGWAVVNYYTISKALEMGHEVTVILNKNSKNIEIKGVNIYTILQSESDSFLKMFNVYRDVSLIKKYLNIHSFDIIHILVESFLPLLLYINHPNTIMTIHGSYSIRPFKNIDTAYFYRRALKKVTKIVSVSDYTAKRFSLNNTCAIPIHVVPLGVNYYNFSQCKPSLSEKEKAFVFVGHIKLRKGLIYALQAIKILTENYPETKLYVIGSGSGKYVEMCHKYVVDNDLNNNVIFMSQVSNEILTQVYHKCIGNILPSINESDYFEGFGLIHLEANACGIPTIGSHDCGNESAIIDGKTGYLCNQKDVQCLAERMKNILEIFEKNQFLTLSEFCIEHAKNNDWMLYFIKLNQIYAE